MRQSLYIRSLKAVTAILLFTPFSLIAGCAYLFADENNFDALTMPGWISDGAGKWFGDESVIAPESNYATGVSNKTAPTGYAHAPTH